MFKVTEITEDTVTIWDGKSHTFRNDPKYKASLTLTVGPGHDFAVGDEVVVSIQRKSGVQNEQSS